MNKVKYYRLISGLLLKDLSEKTGLSVGHLSHIENGNKQPSKSAMESIALAVGSTVPEVFYTPLMITEEMVLLLIFWRLIQNTEKKKAAERGIEYNPDNLVFCTRKGTYIYPRNFTKMWSENLRSMGIDHKRFHDLRHTVATVMLEDGEAMNTVQEQLGHYDAGFTASRYGHVTAKMRNSAAVKLGERLEKVRNPEAEDAEDANSVKNEDTVIPFQEGRKLKSAACKIK